MFNETNPHENSLRAAHDETEYSFLRRGLVSSVDTDQSGALFRATVQEAGISADRPIPIIPTVHGDFYVPPKDTPVAVAPFGKNNYAIVGAPIPPVDTPSLDPGERVISHPLSQASIKFNKDGSLDIYGNPGLTVYGGPSGAGKVELQSDGTVVLNDGTQGVITNVEAGARNQENGITQLDITREDTILV